MIVGIYYDSTTGEAYQQLIGPDQSGFPDVPSGKSRLFMAQAISLPGYVSGGTYTPLPSRPSIYHEFNWSTKVWEDTRTIQDLRDAKWALVKKARDAQEFGPFTWNSNEFDGDETSQLRLTLATIRAQAAIAEGDTSWSVDWTLTNNTTIELSATDVVEVAIALGANIANAHANARAKYALIQAANSQEELDEI